MVKPFDSHFTILYKLLKHFIKKPEIIVPPASRKTSKHASVFNLFV